MGKKDYKNRLEKMLADLEEGQNVTTEEDHNGSMEVDQQLVKRSSV
jgi:endoribonuclease Dicer